MTEATGNDEEVIEIVNEPEKLEPVEVVIDGDKSEIKAVEEKVESRKAEAEIIPAQDGIKELERQLKAMQARADNEARLRKEAEARSEQISRSAVDANLNMVVSEIESAKIASNQAKIEYQRALESGDYAKAADAQEKIADARANLLRLQERRQEVEAAKTVQPRQPVPVNEVEQLASRLSPASADWVRRHPEVAKNFDSVAEAHNKAIHKFDLTPDTPEYFNKVEELLGMRSPAKAEPEVSKPRAPIAAQAPVTRDAPSLSTGKQQRQTITLTAEERAMAREMGYTDKEWAIAKFEAIKAGDLKG